MKPKDFIKKHGLTNNKPLTEDFWKDFITEFNVVVKDQNGLKNTKGFETAVSVLKSKWDSIKSHSANKYIDLKAWNWFYACTVIPKKKELFPENV